MFMFYMYRPMFELCSGLMFTRSLWERYVTWTEYQPLLDNRCKTPDSQKVSIHKIGFVCDGGHFMMYSETFCFLSRLKCLVGSMYCGQVVFIVGWFSHLWWNVNAHRASLTWFVANLFTSVNIFTFFFFSNEAVCDFTCASSCNNG